MGWLCGLEGYPSFEKGLHRISELLWAEYRKPGMQDRPNRYSRSIINLANGAFGFMTQDNVVVAGPLGGAAFGQRVRSKVLWKDSFALGHGEFSHSYPWLTAGLVLNWGVETGQHDANVAGRMSRIPLTHRENRRCLGNLPLFPASASGFPCSLGLARIVGKAIQPCGRGPMVCLPLTRQQRSNWMRQPV